MSTKEYYEAVYNTDRPELKVLHYDGEKITHISHLCTAVTIAGDIAQAYRKCELDLSNTINGLTQMFHIDLANEIRVMVGKAEIFRGPLFIYNVDDKGGAQAVAYDYNYYLTKSMDSEKFVGMTATQIIRQLCNKFGIPAGSLVDTKYVIPRMILREKTLFDMMVIALTETEKKTGRKYSLVNKWGKLYLLERKEQLKRIIFENQRTLLASSYAKSNEERKTAVKLVNESGKAIAGTAQNASSVEKYGTMQHYEIVEDATTQTALNAMARKMLEELDTTEEEFSIDALGLIDVISGTAIIVNERMANLYGAFYVQQDTHSFDASGLHTMSLKLSRTLDIPREEYEEPQLSSPAAAGGTGGSTGTVLGNNGIVANVSYSGGFIATAYDPNLGGINGSGDYSVTATGTKWKAYRTIAVDPRIIPYGSVVAIKVPSMPKYNGLYLAEDTGGAIRNENGGKRIDILLNGRSETFGFGRRQVEVAIVERGTGASDARDKAKRWSSIVAKYKTAGNAGSSGGTTATGKRGQVVSIASKYVGKLTYVFGGKNISGGSGDCSGFTYFVYKQVGVNLGHGTSNQVRKGVQISASEAQPGDLVFFKGTYRSGVSHVGIVTRPGYCISLASSGCKEHGYLPHTDSQKYWSKHYYQIRRVL